MKQRLRDSEGKLVILEARNPQTVCCPEALLAAAIVSVGVKQHPRFPFEVLHEEIDDLATGEKIPLIRWRWVFRAESEDRLYKTAELVKWARDPQWRKANPAHEFALVLKVLANMDAVALAARTAVPFHVIRRGLRVAHIPANAPEDRRTELLRQLAA